MDFLDAVYFGNAVRDYAIAAAAVIGVVLATRVAVLILLKRVQTLASRTTTSLDDSIIGVLCATKLSLAAIVALEVGVRFLHLPPGVIRFVRIAAAIALLLQMGVWASAAIRAGVERLRQKKLEEGDTSSTAILTLIGGAIRGVAWAVVILLILENLGVDITALVAGLGIGGIAIALAVQTVLSDLLASVSIMLDRPFEIGDSIQIDGLSGTVQHIGIKTTRIRAVSGEELVFSNNDLLSSRIHNFKRMEERRISFVVGATYESSPSALEGLPQAFRALIEAEEHVRFDRAHLKSLAASSIDFEVVYYVTSPDYALYMDIQQRINLAILRTCEEMGIGIAYPTQTLYLNKAD